LLIISLFSLISLIYFSPVLSGNKLYQSDIVQYIGMAKEQIEYRKTTGKEAYWNNRAFAGMPTYQNGALYPWHLVKKIDKIIRFLPRPADYLFIYLISFFVLLRTFKVERMIAFFGALVFGFSTYMIIILGVGHNAKAHAIGYMPLVVSGVLLTFNKERIKGALLFCIAMALELVANHFQMTYYLLLLLIILGGVYLYEAVKSGKIKDFLIDLSVLVIGLLLALGMNATSLMATKEYADFSTRGGERIALGTNGEVEETKGLAKDYILSYSYGKLETFNLLVPRFMGGSSSENAGEKASIVKELMKLGYPYNEAKKFAQKSPTYWGDQPYVGAPAYLGAGVIFLAVLALFLVKQKDVYWLTGASILALLLSWGSNFESLSLFFINYVPLYNKFRAVTSIQVIVELCVPLLAMIGLHYFFQSPNKELESQKKKLMQATGVVGGLLVVFILGKNTLFSFSNVYDQSLIQSAGFPFVKALREDRARLLTEDSIRSLLIILTIATVLFAWLKKKLKKQWTVIIIGFVLVLDLVQVARRYVNDADFVSVDQMDYPYQPNSADLEILKDTTDYRVYDLTVSPFNSSRTAYFHQTIGGYHGAKPNAMQNLNDYYISSGYQPVLNMLNVKYFIYEDENSGIGYQENKDALGSAWFIEELVSVSSDKEALLKLKKLQLQKQAVITTKALPQVRKFSKDTSAVINLLKKEPHYLSYQTKNTDESFVVLSEMYYKNGWEAFIDGKQVSIEKVNYTLRGLFVPKGNHHIEFKFDPPVVRVGGYISLMAFVVFIIVLLVGWWSLFKKQKT